jgi:hypothetical protein
MGGRTKGRLVQRGGGLALGCPDLILRCAQRLNPPRSGFNYQFLWGGPRRGTHLVLSVGVHDALAHGDIFLIRYSSELRQPGGRPRRARCPAPRGARRREPERCGARLHERQDLKRRHLQALVRPPPPLRSPFKTHAKPPSYPATVTSYRPRTKDDAVTLKPTGKQEPPVGVLGVQHQPDHITVNDESENIRERIRPIAQSHG